eukprot:353851-Chlamydomonas_euryale.AAC.16
MLKVWGPRLRGVETKAGGCWPRPAWCTSRVPPRTLPPRSACLEPGREGAACRSSPWHGACARCGRGAMCEA